VTSSAVNPKLKIQGERGTGAKAEREEKKVGKERKKEE